MFTAPIKRQVDIEEETITEPVVLEIRRGVDDPGNGRVEYGVVYEDDTFGPPIQSVSHHLSAEAVQALFACEHCRAIIAADAVKGGRDKKEALQKASEGLSADMKAKPVVADAITAEAAKAEAEKVEEKA